jgi:ADP-ribose pyrophosphatase YjhB (NUDIX family)
MEWGEHPHDALRRELVEETGLTIDVGGLCDLWSNADTSSGLHLVGLVFAAQVTGGSLRLSAEHTDSGWWSCERLGSLPLSDGLRRHLLGHRVPDRIGGSR